MKWGIRWYGAKDHILINHIRQIPGVDGVLGPYLGKCLEIYGRWKRSKL